MLANRLAPLYTHTHTIVVGVILNTDLEDYARTQVRVWMCRADDGR